MRRSWTDANMLYSRAERVLILQHKFLLKSFAAVREALRKFYLDKKEPYKTTTHRLVKTFHNQCTNCGIRLQEFDIATVFFVL
jgi:hypothetical protein